MLTAAREQLCESGFLWLRQAIASERVDSLSSALDRAFDADVAEWGRERLREAGQLGAIRNLCDLDPEFEWLLQNCPANDVLDAVLRPDYVLHAYDGLVLEPGDGRFPWDFHTDLMALQGINFGADRIPGINVLVYLDDTPAESGATWIVPGSHWLRSPPAAANALAALACQATGRPGDLLLFDGRLWHCAGNNHGRRPRRLIKMMYSEDWIRPMMDYRRSLSEGKWNRLPARVRKLLGESASPPAGTGEFRARIGLLPR